MDGFGDILVLSLAHSWEGSIAETNLTAKMKSRSSFEGWAVGSSREFESHRTFFG